MKFRDDDRILEIDRIQKMVVNDGKLKCYEMELANLITTKLICDGMKMGCVNSINNLWNINIDSFFTKN